MMTPEQIAWRADILINEKQICERYHRWYYETNVWATTRYMGIPVQKSVSDLWSYQEILFDLKPKLVIEFGTFKGGSALFFADVLEKIHEPFPSKVVTVDINHSEVDPRARKPWIEFITASSTAMEVTNRLLALRRECYAPCFAILDSDHSAEHVFAEMLTMKEVLRPGDWLIVEDGNINGHPVTPNVAPGPWEAIKEYERHWPEDYTQDRVREKKFGFTFAPEGFLVRR